jgi:hypothetical protein
MKRREFIVALLIALSASFGFWYYKHIVFDAPLSKDVDLSELFKSGSNETWALVISSNCPIPRARNPFRCN